MEEKEYFSSIVCTGSSALPGGRRAHFSQGIDDPL